MNNDHQAFDPVQMLLRDAEDILHNRLINIHFLFSFVSIMRLCLTFNDFDASKIFVSFCSTFYFLCRNLTCNNLSPITLCSFTVFPVNGMKTSSLTIVPSSSSLQNPSRKVVLLCLSISRGCFEFYIWLWGGMERTTTMLGDICHLYGHLLLKCHYRMRLSHHTSRSPVAVNALARPNFQYTARQVLT